MKRNEKGKFMSGPPEKDFSRIKVEECELRAGDTEHRALRFIFTYETRNREVITIERESLITHGFAEELLALVDGHEKRNKSYCDKMDKIIEKKGELRNEHFKLFSDLFR